MYYTLVSFPKADMTAIDQLRRKYDPTVDLIEPHLAVVFPVPESLGERELVDHCTAVLQGWRPFQAAAGPLVKTPDHWLLLALSQGASVVTRLYRDLNSGFLSDYARPDLFQPHIGLGQFVKAGRSFDWHNPSEADLDEDRYAQALREAKELALEISWVIDSLDLVELPDEVIAWARGSLSSYPHGARAVRAERFELGHRT
jgi:2'-5' RNA ligase superfamily